MKTIQICVKNAKEKRIFHMETSKRLHQNSWQNVLPPLIFNTFCIESDVALRGKIDVSRSKSRFFEHMRIDREFLSLLLAHVCLLLKAFLRFQVQISKVLKMHVSFCIRNLVQSILHAFRIIQRLKGFR